MMRRFLKPDVENPPYLTVVLYMEPLKKSVGQTLFEVGER